MRVERKPLELLILLVSREGQLVTRPEIVEKLWASDVFVDTEHGINTAIRKLRLLLRDDPGSPQYIQTVTGLGYRWVAPVNCVSLGEQKKPDKFEPSGSAAAIELGEPPEQVHEFPLQVPRPAIKPHARRNIGITIAAGLLLAAGFIGQYLARPLPSWKVSYKQITHGGGHKTPAGTDGTRLYFQRDSGDAIGVINVDGGEPTTIPLSLAQAGIGGLWMDGSSMLLGSDSGDNYSLWRLQLPGGPLRKIVENDSLKDGTGLDVSPDGNWIALIQGRGHLILMSAIDGSTMRTLVAPPKNMSESIGGDVTWSPDGKRLRFTWNHRFWEVTSDGSALHPLHPNWHPGLWECCGHWTSDGKFFAFVSPDKSIETPLPVGQLWILNESLRGFQPAKSNPIQLTDGPMDWSNLISAKVSGKLFAEGIVLRSRLVRFDQSSRVFKPMWHDIPAEFVEYSPDSKSVVFVTFPDGLMWRSDRDGTNRVQLTFSPSYPVNPHWSPDGTRILFFTNSYSKTRDAYVVSAQGGHSEKIPAKTQVYDPTWSPDAKRILYATAGLEHTTQSEIEIMNLETHETTAIPGSLGLWSPRWSPDGKSIAALDPTWSLWIFDFKTQKWTMLEKGVCSFPTWSRDSQSIYFNWSLTSNGIYRVSLKGGKPEKVADLTGFGSTGALFNWFGLDPDGMPLLLQDEGSDEIYSLTFLQD